MKEILIKVVITTKEVIYVTIMQFLAFLKTSE